MPSFFTIIASCFPPTEQKRQAYKLCMMRQDFIESDRDLAHKLIDKGVDFQTLGPAKYEDAPMEAMAGNFKKWYTKHWDRGVGADLSPDEKQRILKLTE